MSDSLLAKWFANPQTKDDALNNIKWLEHVGKIITEHYKILYDNLFLMVKKSRNHQSSL